MGAVPIDRKIVAKPTDLFVCRFKEGYEENISLARLRQLGASFSFTRAPITAAAFTSAVSGGLANQGPGGGRRFEGPVKPGAQRILDAMSMSSLWNHKMRGGVGPSAKGETVVSASIHDDAELTVHEALRLLKSMKEQGREIGVSFWESPERKCLNECTLPLPPSVLAQLAEEDAAAAAAAAAASGSGSGSGTGLTKGRVGCGKQGLQKQHPGGVVPVWPKIPGGWAEPRHCHTAPLVVWATGPSRARVRAKGEFVDHCSAAMLGSSHFPPGAELMLMDGFLHGTGVLEKHAVFQRYRRRPWAQLSPEDAPGLQGPAKLPPGATTRLQWKKDGAAVGTAPWTAALDSTTNEERKTSTPEIPTTTTAANATRAPPPGATATAGMQQQQQQQQQGPHFRACIVCQRPGTDSNGAAVDGPAPPCLPQARGPAAAGPLLLCSTCPAAFHLSCLRPRLRKMPEGTGEGGSAKWSCAYCHAMGRVVGGDADGACGAVRLMESLRQGMHGTVRVNAMRTLRYNALG
ncbi:hypothetical protein Esi_0007_0057 [Ectocarpus siliculosus]|uniref:PHD-type domain-containing protein n=1 Tax=Ectocarpus siliculosus TaxID=2880 RepID=D8LS03_ECTSI|nr:hypothetical protein Esi_0007_0057 [Ectocarpus siliculosus]|eukprot:CBN73787.1 hypothetical protein Esi_0007_0057 [Ectocarpus siliculosus]